MLRAIALIAMLSVSGPVMAMIDEHPQRNHELTQWYDDHMCVAVLTNQCINNVCLRSTERDCKEQCEKAASAKCQHEAY